MMNSKLGLAAILTFALLLGACSSGTEASSAQGDSDQPAQTASTDQNTEGSADTQREIARLAEVELPVETLLILGTLNLETTDLAVDPVQAAELVVLWKALRSLSASDTAAEAEITAVLDQIQDTMTADQIQAIEAMQLSPEDIQTVVQDHGFEFGAPEGFEGFQGESQDRFGGGGGFRGGDQFGGGGDHGGGGGPSGGGQFGEGGRPGGEGQFGRGSQGDTADHEPGAEDGFERFGRRAGGFLIEPLIELLAQRAGIEGA